MIICKNNDIKITYIVVLAYNVLCCFYMLLRMKYHSLTKLYAITYDLSFIKYL